MAQISRSFKKKKHFLDLINGIPPDKLLFCPIDVSKHFHVAIFHDIQCRPHSDFFDFSASKHGFDQFVTQLQHWVSTLSPSLVFMGMEPTNVYYENLLFSLHQRFSSSLVPKFEFAILDPAAVSSNRHQQSLHCEKEDQIDCAAIGELLTRGLYLPAHWSPPLCIRIKELSRSIQWYHKQPLRLWNRFLARLDRVFPHLMIDSREEKPFCQQPQQNKLLDDRLHRCPDPYTLLELQATDLIELFHQKGRPLGPKKAEKIRQAAQRALLLPKAYQEVHLELFAAELETLDFLRQQIQPLTQTLNELIGQTPARHLLAMAGNSDKLTADLIAGLEDWRRYPAREPVWKAAGLNPVKTQSGSSSSEPHGSLSGSVYLRHAIDKMTCTVVWHEPPFGIPCFERLLRGYPFIPTIRHVGRKLTHTALALLKSDAPFPPPFPNYAAAKEKLSQLQEQYLKQKNPTR